MIGYAIFSGTVAFSLMCVSYEIMAQRYEWPIGAILARPLSLPKIVALVSGVYAFGKSFVVFEWWSPLVVLVIGQSLAFVLTMALKKNAQAVSIIGVFLGFILTALYASESRPLGFLQTLFS